jgi:hypothetical protein
MANRNPIIRLLEWAGHYQTIQAILQAEFIRTLLLPTLTAVATGVAGWLNQVPLMWIIMAVALAFMGAMQGVLSASSYLERKNPAYKLQVIKHLFNFSLVPVGGPNRKQRRAAKAQDSAPAVPAYRHLEKGQLGFEVWNRASFPMSVVVVSADTEIEGERPPMAKFPKKPIIIQPGTTMWIHDDPISLGDMLCENLDGKIDIRIKYGRPGRERFELDQRGTVEIFMESYGLYKGMYFHPETSEAIPRSSS